MIISNPSSLTIVGAQWGDEGKGKIIDFLTESAEIVVRFQGGNNAGHTLVVNGVTTKLHLIPSGILRADAVCCIGAGVVLDCDVLISELAGLKKSNINIDPSRIYLDPRIALILPTHVALDKAREIYRGQNKIGTTGRGIGPCYEDRINRSGLRLMDLYVLDQITDRLKKEVSFKNKILRYVLETDEQIEYEEVYSYLLRAKEKLLPYIKDVSKFLIESIGFKKKILFEGAQGVLLDNVFGFVPYVTSSNTVAGAVSTGLGISPNYSGKIVGVFKAYTTRVGMGPMPTELDANLDDHFVTVGQEFGTTTGRRRRCGWLDMVSLNHSIALSGIDCLAITKIDVLRGLEKIKICTSYKTQNIDNVEKISTECPLSTRELENSVGFDFEQFDGFEQDITKIKNYLELPQSLKQYLQFIEDTTKRPLALISVGPGREQTIVTPYGQSFW